MRQTQSKRQRISSNSVPENWTTREDDESHSFGAQSEDYERYLNYEDIEDVDYKQSGRNRTGGRGGTGRGYDLNDREAHPYSGSHSSRD